jgi:glucosamine-6-phosphate deaminase
MGINIFGSKEKASKYVAMEVIKLVKRKKGAVLGLATGKTMIPLYKELVRLSKKMKVSFGRVRTFNLDEYYGVSSGDKKSMRYFMDKHFFNKIDIKDKNIHFLSGEVKDWSGECGRYEREIKKSGGIDFMILGIGRNGHIAFNEPGSGGKSKTRRVRLRRQTKKINKVKYGYALSIGVGTIMKSKKIILLAFGKEKREPVERALNDKIGASVPASFLRLHRNAEFVVDKNSSGKLN